MRERRYRFSRDEAAALAQLQCAGCGYSLRGLAIDGVCPECATPVIRSTPGGLLRHLDAYELIQARARLGLWCATMILLALWEGASALACPALATASPDWIVAGGLVQSVLLGVAAIGWGSIMQLRRGTAYIRLRRAAVWGLALIVSAAVLGGVAQWCWGKGLQTWRIRNEQWAIAGVSVSALSSAALVAFFHVGTRFTSAMARQERIDAGWHQWVNGLALAGVVCSLLSQSLLLGWIAHPLMNLLGPDAPKVVGSISTAAGGLLLGSACMVWVVLSERAERRAAAYIDDADVARLNRVLQRRD